MDIVPKVHGRIFNSFTDTKAKVVCQCRGYFKGEHPVVFASRKLLLWKNHYLITEKECLAIVWAIQKFQNFLYWKSFILKTDHQPLLYFGNA